MPEQTPPTPSMPAAPPTSSAPPAPAAPDAPAAPGAPGATVALGSGMSIAGAKPAEVYAALRAQRRVLVEQLERLEDQRQGLAAGLSERPVDGTERQGIEQRIASVDQRIAEVNQQIAVSEREIARVAGIPGAAVEPPTPRRDDDDEAGAIVGTVFTIFVLFPLAIAHARRVWRRSAKAVVALPGELADRFTRLEQAVDSVAIEVERVSEGQRFVTRILAEGRGADPQRGGALGAGAAQPVEIKAPQPAPAYRSGSGRP